MGREVVLCPNARCHGRVGRADVRTSTADTAVAQLQALEKSRSLDPPTCNPLLPSLPDKPNPRRHPLFNGLSGGGVGGFGRRFSVPQGEREPELRFRLRLMRLFAGQNGAKRPTEGPFEGE